MEQCFQLWEAESTIPTTILPLDTETWTHGNTPAQYGAKCFADVFTSRQLFAHGTSLRELTKLQADILRELPEDRANAVATYLAFAFDKCLDYNSRMMRWDGTRDKIVNTFSRHDFAFKWSHAEFDAARNILPWALDQVVDACRGIAGLSAVKSTMFKCHDRSPVERLVLGQGAAQSLTYDDASIRVICVDPPYYDNVNYAELSDFFYVWAADLTTTNMPGTASKCAGTEGRRSSSQSCSVCSLEEESQLADPYTRTRCSMFRRNAPRPWQTTAH